MVLAIIIGIAILLLLGLIFISYVKCPPDMVYLISGLKKEPRVIIGKATLRIPFFERVDKLTLEKSRLLHRAMTVKRSGLSHLITRFRAI